MSSEPHIELSRAPLLAHLLELRTRLIRVVLVWVIASMLGYLIVEPAYQFLVEPLASAFPDPSSRRLIYTSLAETFITYVKLSCFIGLMVAFPYIASQVYLFLAPGLYKREKRVLLPYLVGGPLLFFAGAALAYFFVMPMAWEFFASFESKPQAGGMAIALEAKVSEYLSLVLHIILAFGLAFQLPILLTLLVRVGMVKTTTLTRGRRYAVVILLTASAFLTPPDVLSQILLFIPLYLLYELAIIGCKRIDKTRQAKEHTPDARHQMDTSE
ncbi:MAG: twin-arginine translocase subunit TatC [Alphaproteobacteria bacterium]|nr:twin-arginine translocase subunit TatC [Alphaproteobacteria bacterium]